MTQTDDGQLYLGRFLAECPPHYRSALEEILEHLPEDRLCEKVHYQIGLPSDQLARAKAELASDILLERLETAITPWNDTYLKKELALAMQGADNTKPRSWPVDLIVRNARNQAKSRHPGLR